ncbi:MAG: GntR family transcriptional regulator [Planctomycetota bacterium]
MTALQDSAYRRIREMIFRAEIKTGELYSEAKIAELLGMSRTPVRGALAVLSREGLIEISPQRGFCVRLIPKEEMREIFELRLALETKIAVDLAGRVSDVDFAPLTENIERTKAAMVNGNKSQFLEVSTEFHYEIARMAGFHLAVDVLKNLRDKLRILGIAAVTDARHMATVIEEHTLIYVAIQNKDIGQVHDLIRRHLGCTEDRLKEVAEY